MCNVILLNKPFLGGWLDAKGNIGHEIIDFLQTDGDQYYVYNNPWGVCPDNIWVNGTTGLQRNSKEQYIGKYLVLTSEERGNEFDILYVIELSEKLHRYHKSRDKKQFLDNQNQIKQLIRKKNILYNGKYLDQIYQNDDSLFLTFKGAKIYKAINPITVTGLTYNFQRNKGYIYDDKYPEDYNKVLGLIESAIHNGSSVEQEQNSNLAILQEITPKSVNPDQIGQLYANNTFINLIQQEDNEQIFTNILFSVLEQDNLLNRFCDRFKGNKVFNSTESFEVFRETKVVDGRMDVCAESINQRIIIENKINSGLNGIRPADNTSQLTIYYNWGMEKPTKPLCFVVAPNYRRSEIVREIRGKDPNMENIYQLITYGDIACFIENEIDNGSIPQSYAYYSLLPQIVNAFKNLSYSTKEDLYAKMFLSASNNNH